MRAVAMAKRTNSSSSINNTVVLVGGFFMGCLSFVYRVV
jgi:hypothetical protein